MTPLVLHPTPTAQWHQLVVDAKEALKVTLEEDVESYLVFLLMRYVCFRRLSKFFVAEEYMRAEQALSQSARRMKLRRTGDMCLAFSGLFPGIVERRMVSLQYYIDMGRTAYGELAEDRELKSLRKLYFELSKVFPTLVELLWAMRDLETAKKHGAIPEKIKEQGGAFIFPAVSGQ